MARKGRENVVDCDRFCTACETVFVAVLMLGLHGFLYRYALPEIGAVVVASCARAASYAALGQRIVVRCAAKIGHANYADLRL
jgi:hypothetical protein